MRTNYSNPLSGVCNYANTSSPSAMPKSNFYRVGSRKAFLVGKWGNEAIWDFMCHHPKWIVQVTPTLWRRLSSPMQQIVQASRLVIEHINRLTVYAKEMTRQLHACGHDYPIIQELIFRMTNKAYRISTLIRWEWCRLKKVVWLPSRLPPWKRQKVDDVSDTNVTKRREMRERVRGQDKTLAAREHFLLNLLSGVVVAGSLGVGDVRDGW